MMEATSPAMAITMEARIAQALQSQQQKLLSSAAITGAATEAIALFTFFLSD